MQPAEIEFADGKQGEQRDGFPLLAEERSELERAVASIAVATEQPWSADAELAQEAEAICRHFPIGRWNIAAVCAVGVDHQQRLVWPECRCEHSRVDADAHRSLKPDERLSGSIFVQQFDGIGDPAGFQRRTVLPLHLTREEMPHQCFVAGTRDAFHEPSRGGFAVEG